MKLLENHEKVYYHVHYLNIYILNNLKLSKNNSFIFNNICILIIFFYIINILKII